jgi:spermidine synthase
MPDVIQMARHNTTEVKSRISPMRKKLLSLPTVDNLPKELTKVRSSSRNSTSKRKSVQKKDKPKAKSKTISFNPDVLTATKTMPDKPKELVKMKS